MGSLLEKSVMYRFSIEYKNMSNKFLKNLDEVCNINYIHIYA